MNNNKQKSKKISDFNLNKVSKKMSNKVPTHISTKSIKGKEEMNTDKMNNTLLSSSFPIIIIIIMILLFGIFYYLINTYKEEVIINSNGFMLTNDNRTLLLGSKKKNEDTNIIKTLSVKENEIIYKTPISYYLENEKDKSVNMDYPLFINNGITIVNYNDNINLINNNFDRTFGYKGLILTYGKLYDAYEYTQVDKENYLIMSYKDGININLYDLKIKTTLHEYNIPTNSFIYFEKDCISYYERKDNSFIYNTIKDIDYKSLLTFYYETTKEKYEYNYEKFLEGIGTIYVVADKIPEKDDEIIPGDNETEEKDPNQNVPSRPNNNEEEFKYIKPDVKVNKFVPNVYSMKNTLDIKDPSGVIVKAPTFTLYSNGKVWSNRMFYSSGEIIIGGLIPNTEFTIVGKYTYLDEDMKTKKIVTFYTKTIKTNELSTLSPIDMSFENGQIYPKKIELEKVKVISDLNSEAIMGVNKIVLEVNDSKYYLTANQISSIISGIETQVSTGESLNSSSTIDYKFSFYDRANNEINSINNTGSTRTSKRFPNIALRIKTNNVDEVVIGISKRNEDNIVLNNYIYTVTSESGKIIKQDYIKDSKIIINGLNPNQIFNIKVTADIDINDGQGVHKNYELSSMDFTTKPITSLGYINLNTKQKEITYNSASIEYQINSRKTNAILVKLLQELKFELYENGSDKPSSVINLTKSEIEKVKEKEILTIKFNNLKSNKKYNLKIISKIVQGDSEYLFDCVYSVLEVNTNKLPAKVNVTNSFTTETMVDFDVIVDDIDKTIVSKYLRIELKDDDNNTLDVKTIDIINEPTRITYNNLEVKKFYTINFYADEYNETNSNETFKYKHLISSWTIYTDEGISGKIELISSLREARGSNLIDVNSEVKWLQTEQYYNIPKTVDSDGNLHIYSKSGSGAYTFDLSDYHGEIVTVTFKAKSIGEPRYKLHFTQYFSGSKYNGHGKEVVGLNSKNWTDFTYTFKVGSYSYVTTSDYFINYSGNGYGKNYNDMAGFLIEGGDNDLTEYVIKDLDVHIQYNHETVDIGNLKLEPGYYNYNGSKNNNNSEYYVRLNDAIFLEGGNYYSIEYNNLYDYKFYVYLYDEKGRTKKSYGYYATESAFYVPEDWYAKIFIRYKDGKGLVLPEEIKNLKIKKFIKKNVESNPTYLYDLITKLKVNLTDRRNEIANDNYFVTVYDSDKNELFNKEYIELKNTNVILNQIKKVDLEENKNYIIELRIKIRDRYYTLNSFEISTKDEVLPISSTNDWRFIQPYGNYIFLNDVDFTNYTDQRLGWGYRYFHGSIDFQGYKMIVSTAKTDGESNLNNRRINRLEKDAVLKNLVLVYNLNNQKINNNLHGVFGTNYGLIENLNIIVKDTHNKNMPQLYTSPLLDINAMSGKVRNFTIKIDGELHYYSDSSIICRTNHGLIENGYIYGDDIVADYRKGDENPKRSISVISRYSGVKSSINNVYSLINIKMPNNLSEDKTGIFAYETYGKVSNSYVFGDTNEKKPNYGPIVGYIGPTARFNNTFYISDNIYTSNFQQKASLVSLTDKVFQKSVLGDAFEIDELLDLGYYPQVKYSSTKMPIQDYIELPIVTEDEYADIITMDVIESTNNSALVNVHVNNILGEEITNISISDLDTKIISQSYSEGKSNVILEVKHPKIYASRYQVKSISTVSTNGYTSTRKYDIGEKYLLVDFYKEIKTVDDFVNINNGLNQNYIIMNDLDFSGYVKFHIRDFSGKIDGNNHTLKNIDLVMSGKNGLFNRMNGTLQNINFENIYINPTNTSQYGIVGYSNQYSKFYNVHINNIKIIVEEDITRENIYIGPLVANSYSSKIDYCSASNVTIVSKANVYGIIAGGLVGYSNASVISNSFVSEINGTIENATSSNGLGGIVGREISSLGVITESYSTGKLTSNVAYVGGISGQYSGYIDKSFSTVDVSSDLNFVGGIAGYIREVEDSIINCLYLGNIYTSSVDSTKKDDLSSINPMVNRISGNYKSNDSNYALDSALINGVSSNREKGEKFVSYEELLNSKKYEIILGDTNAFDFSKSNEAIIPKLYYGDMETLMPNQKDNKLFKNIFNIDNLVMDKSSKFADVTMYLKNPEGFKITDIEINNARIEIIKNINTDGLTVLEFKLYPDKYLDNYKLSYLHYKNLEGKDVKTEKNYRINAVFYKDLSSFNDWQNVSKTIPENYRLTKDIDFSREENINTGLVFNRLETPGENVNYKLKGIKIVNKRNRNYVGAINKILTSFKNITVEDFEIEDKTTGANNYSNFLIFNYANLENLTFKNIKIDSQRKHYAGIIGNNAGAVISNIILDNVIANGNNRTSGFISYTKSSLDYNFHDIDAKNIHINSIGYYVGGIFGEFSTSIDYGDKPIYNNFHISDSSVISTSNYIGGITGYGDANNSSVTRVNVKGYHHVGGVIGQYKSSVYKNTVKDSLIEAEGYYAGGITGYSNNIYDSYVIDTNVVGLNSNSYSIGGLTGYKAWGTIARNGVINSTISNNGNNTGGICGEITGGTIMTSYVSGGVVSGVDKTGGIVGKMTYPDIRQTRTIGVLVNSTNKYAGGIVGSFENNNSYGNINEGYVRECTVEKSTIKAKSNAGGFIGTVSSNLYYSNRVRRLYSDSDVVVEDGINFGIAAGNQYDKDVINQPSIYFYKNTMVNNGKISDIANDSVLGNNILDLYTFYHGYINSNGTVEQDDRQVKLMYSDMIFLEKDKQYQIDIGHDNQTNLFNIYLYNSEGKFISQFNSWTAEGDGYIDKYVDLSYVDSVKFNTYKDCYIRIYFNDVPSVLSKSLREVQSNGAFVTKDKLLSTKDLMERLTWTNYMNDTDYVKYAFSRLNFDRNYWDFNVINSNIPDNVSISDKSENKYILNAHTESVSKNGMKFNGIDNYATIKDYKLPSSGNLTLQTNLTSLGRRGYEWVFSSRDSNTKDNGFGIFIHYNQIYVWIYNTWYNTNIYIPYTTKEVNIAVTYEDNKLLKVYLDGRLGYTRTINRKLINKDTSHTYISYDDVYNSPSYRYIGTIRNMMVYDRVLNQDEINNNISSSSGITNTNNLNLYYDFSQTNLNYESYYPILKYKDHEILNQSKTTIPSDDITKISNTRLFSSNSLYSPVKNYKIYSSGIDTINLEFENISKDLSFVYENNNGKYKINVDKKVYTLSYDYIHDAKITIKNAFETKIINLDPNDFAKKVSIYSNKYYYIENNKLYENNNEIISNALHIKNNLVLLKNNRIYNLKTKEIQNNISSSGILANEIPLYQNSINDKTISTFYNFTMINNEEKPGQIIVNNNELYMFNLNEDKSEYILFNKYNNKEYQIVLNNKNKLDSYKEEIKYPKSFVNANIKQISFDTDSRKPLIIVLYNSGNIIAFNYVSGEKTFESGKSMNATLFEFISSEFNKESTSVQKSKLEYKRSQNLIKELESVRNSEVKEHLDSININDNSISNKLTKKYISTYNSNNNQYEIYNVNELLNDNKVIENEQNEIISLENKKNETKKPEVKSMNDKLISNIFLYDYFYNDKKASKLDNGKIYIYITIILAIIINLVVLSIKYGNKEAIK